MNEIGCQKWTVAFGLKLHERKKSFCYFCPWNLFLKSRKEPCPLNRRTPIYSNDIIESDFYKRKISDFMLINLKSKWRREVCVRACRLTIDNTEWIRNTIVMMAMLIKSKVHTVIFSIILIVLENWGTASAQQQQLQQTKGKNCEMFFFLHSNSMISRIIVISVLSKTIWETTYFPFCTGWRKKRVHSWCIESGSHFYKIRIRFFKKNFFKR